VGECNLITGKGGNCGFVVITFFEVGGLQGEECIGPILASECPRLFYDGNDQIDVVLVL
jgi:hypothetical protein